MKTVCDFNQCTGCMACLEICPNKAIRVIDEIKCYNASIDDDRCCQCGACYRICQVNNAPSFFHPIEWHQGWASDQSSRMKSSSGGIGYEIERTFLKKGHVWSCSFKNGAFLFSEAKDTSELDSFRGSKYVKSSPAGIYKEIKEQLKKDKVLFVGLPCQVAAIKRFVGDNLGENLYTVDLICHGTCSPTVLNSFLKGHQSSLEKINVIRFREKTGFRLSGDRKQYSFQHLPDIYTMAFMMGLSYTENCYHCQYARFERVSDITIGDSWGSEMPPEEKKKGISLMLVMNDKGKQLIDSADIQKMPVNIEIAQKTNKQLNCPSERPPRRELFFRNFLRNNDLEKAFRVACPLTWLKQKLKIILSAFKLYGNGRYISE